MLGKKTAALLLASLAGVALSGCVGSDDLILDAGLLGLPGMGLHAGAFYGLTHAGGELHLESEGGLAVIDLYDGADERLGRVQVGSGDEGGSFSDAVTLPDVPAGDLVLHMDTIGDGIRVMSGGKEVRGLDPLPIHDERIILIDGDHSPTASGLTGGVLPGEGVQQTVQVQLARAPKFLEVLTTGPYQDLEIKIRGAGGLVYEAHDGRGLEPLWIRPSGGFMHVHGDFIPENVRSGALEVEISAQDLQGDLVLLTRSYSRAVIPAITPYQTTDAMEGFTYGVLPDRPVLFQVSSAAQHILLRAEAAEPEEPQGEQHGETGDGGEASPAGEGESDNYDTSAWASLFDPTDRFLGTFRIPAGQAVAVPVQVAGDHVAVAHRGGVYLGADAVPVDFEMHPLEVAEVKGPSEAAGQDGEYGIGQTTLEPEGVLFGLRPVRVGTPGEDEWMPSTNYDCYGHGNIRVIQGDTIGSWGDATANQVLEANLRLVPGAVDIVFEDWGESGCGREGISVQGYLRPGTTQSEA